MNVSQSAASLGRLALLTCILISASTSEGLSPRADSGGSASSPEKSRRQKAPKVGDHAPLFRLPSLGSETEVDLHDIVGKKPIVLFFGSYT